MGFEPTSSVPGSRPPTGRQALGRAGEAAALAWYRRRGYTLVAANWRCPLGELDLLVARGPVLVVCEVKSRRGSAFGGPFEAVTRTKQRRIRNLAQAFLAASGATPSAVRFDVASVTVARGRTLVEVYEQAF